MKANMTVAMMVVCLAAMMVGKKVLMMVDLRVSMTVEQMADLWAV